MKRYRTRKLCLVALGLVAGWSAPAVCLAQDGDFLQYPRNNVRGGAIAGRRPGLWVGSGLSTAAQRVDIALHDFGGAEPISADQLPPPRRRVFLIAALEAFFDVAQTLADSLTAGAILLGQTDNINTTGGG
jgi:hypothetical protein